jgi:four helix bundle protein
MDGFFFRRLRVYQLSKRLVRYMYDETRRAPLDARTIVWQLLRAASSVTLNIAEGCGEYRSAEKARFFRMARRSSWEAVAALEMLVSLGAIEKVTLARAEAAYSEIGAILTAMAKRQEAMRRTKSAGHTAENLESRQTVPSPSSSSSS